MIPNPYTPYQSLTFFFGTGIAIWSLLLYAYRFLDNTFANEYWWALRLSGGLLGIDLGQVIVSIFMFDQPWPPDTFHSILLSVFLLWAVAVLIRKRRIALHKEDSEEQKRAARAFRAYALLYGLLILFLTSQALINLGIFEFSNLIEIIRGLIFLSFFFGMALVYLNYSPEPTTLQAKLVGIALVTAMALIVAVELTLYPDGTSDESYIEPPQKEAILFQPEEDGYRLNQPVLPYNQTDLGENLSMGDDTTRSIAIGFPFPFAGKTWDSLYVSPNGVVTFGEPIYRDERVRFATQYFYNDVPKIAPLYTDLDPSAGGNVNYNRNSDEIIISWHGVPYFNREGTKNFIQLALQQNGTITFIYDSLSGPLINANRGISTGSTDIQKAFAFSSHGVPRYVEAGAGWYVDFGFIRRIKIHEEVKGLVWLTLGATAFILLLFPFFFRSSIIRPLERLRKGVQRVNEGNLDTEVPVGVRDEIGYLAHHFNQMTRSLKTAEEELKAYAENLEERVSDRTAELKSKNKELEKTLGELRQAQDQLVQQEKLASLGQLTAGIAHEIKNPLNFVNNFSELSLELLEEARETVEPSDSGSKDAELASILDDIEDNLRKIHEHGNRADRIVKSMLQHSRGGKGTKQPTDLNALIEEYLNLSFHGMRAGTNPINVDLNTELDRSIGEIEINPEDISRVLINLFNNAFDAMSEKLEEQKDYQPQLTVRTYCDDGQVVIEVEDNGPGIPKEIREDIMQPFFTTKKGTAGTGLGLSITHDIIKSHGGNIEIESEENSFTKFNISIPTNN